MKKIIAYTFSFLCVAVLFVACRKEDNPQIPALARFPLPLVLKVASADQVISATDPNTFNGKFTVDMFFKTDVPAKKVDVVVRKNNNNGNVKVVKADVTTFPTEVTLTGAQLTTLFGTAPALGDNYDIGVDVTTQEGMKYEAFPVTGAAYAAGITSQPGSNVVVRYSVVCQYDPNIYKGNFVVVSDDWADYAPGDVVPLTMVDATHFSFQYLAANPRPIVVTVNPVSNVVNVPKQVYGSGYPPGWPYGDISVESVPSNDNVVAPCDKTFSVVLRHTVAAGSFGDNKIVLRKQ
jgi:hypothetical protein